MDILLINCSKNKINDDSHDYQPSKLIEILRPKTYHSLMEARLDLAWRLGLQPGPDLGFQGKGDNITYLPAFERYQDEIFQIGEVRQRYKGFKGHLIIFSVLYGLLEASDLIRNYELDMFKLVTSRISVSAFWRKHGIREIIEEYYLAWESATLHDLLSTSYRKVLGTWPTTNITNYQRYDYSEMRKDSIYKIGESLKGLLKN